MVPSKADGFKFESRRTPHMAGFFLWLESVRPALGAELTRALLDAFPRSMLPMRLRPESSKVPYGPP
jgi:hypothetical protein